MYEIEGVRMRYQHGTHRARFHRDVAVAEQTWRIRAADMALLFLVFGAHKIYRQRLQSTRVKGMLYLPDFQSLMKSFLVEWAGPCASFSSMKHRAHVPLDFRF